MSNTIYIAIADDHAMFRKGLMVLINLFPGYQVIFDVNNGKELIDGLNPERLPDIVLMDINMPQMDGYTATEWLTNNYPQIKVLALSTMDAEAAIIKMIKSGAKGYVLKDADTDELKVAFEEVLTRGYFYNETITRKVMQSVSQLTDKTNKTGTFINLSDREIEFLKWSCTELSYKEIAEKMFVSVRTVEGYRDALCEKLALKTRVGLAMYAIKNGLAVL
jgi:DNA-binding NarL/FixJ family response regulator